ncbi:MAG: ParM/StbA family protein [Leptolyngbya sp. SIO4C5]|nr:ParM/StbA family protein [Leptolyngbya sp. SIO4C5]
MEKNQRLEMLQGIQNIKIAFDPGSSVTKVVYQIDSNKPCVLLMEPEVIKVPVESVEQRTYSSAGVVTPVNDAWLKFRARDDNCFAVGFLAQQFKASIQLDQLKYEAAIVKALATIGAVVQREALKESVDVHLAVLLPLGEFADKEKFKEQLTKQARHIHFRDQHIQPNLESLMVSPEGSGFAMKLLREKGQDWFVRREAVCSLMLGHRNSSLLTFNHGQIDMNASSTTDLGFVQLVDKVIEKTSGQSRQSLTRTIYEIGNNISTENILLRSLAKSKQPKNIETEVDQIASAIKIAKQEYWQLLKEWLDGILPTRIDSLCIGGGAGYYLRHEIKSHLGWANPSWSTRDMANTITDAVNQFEDPSLKHRLIDVWNIFSESFESIIESDRVA